MRNDYKLGELKASGQFMTLFRREVKRYFGTSIYFFNTGFGAVTLVVAAAFACFGYRAAIPYVEAFAPLVGGMEMVCGLAVLAIGFFSTTICTTCVSISLEGKTFWILKEAPVSPKTYFSSKIAVNLLVAWPSVLLCTVPLGIVYGVDPVTLAASVFVLLALGRRKMPVPLGWGGLDWGIVGRVLSFGLSPFLTIATDSVLLIVVNTVLQR